VVGEAEISVVPYDHMIQGSNSHNLARFDETSGNLKVFLAGRGIAAGMIMNENHPGRRLPDCRPIHFPGMDQRRSQGPFRNSNHPENAILTVQKDIPETLLFEAVNERLKVAKNLDAGAKRLAGKKGRPGSPFPQMHGSLDSQCFPSSQTRPTKFAVAGFF
jgi:hypothetical protein